MQTNRCISCENETERYPCPHCGFDAQTYQQPNYALPCNHILHGRYLMGRVLGQGGFGITYVGWDLVLQYKCAIKEFYPNGQAMRKSTIGLNLEWSDGIQARELRQTGLESFLKEARKMNKVDHIPQVVRVRDTFVENATAYIVMDYVEGETLKERLERGGILSWEDARSIFLPVIAAMEQVHQAGLVHRDLSPDNLMIQPAGGVKILDLGAAKDLSTNSGASSMQVAKGGFSPLEQYTQRGGSGPWSDVYSMAATMYYSLTGILPPTAIDRLEADTIRWDLPQLKALPRVVLTALQKAMAVTAAKRTQTMGELLKQLKSAPKPKPPKPVKVKHEKPPKVKKEKIKKEKPAREQKPERKPIPKKLRVLAAALALVILGGLIYNALPAPAEKQLAAPGETTVSTEQTEVTAPAETEHVHDWAPATVGSPARCKTCGLMTGTSLDCTLSNLGDSIVGVREDGTVAMARPYGDAVWFAVVKEWKDAVSVDDGSYIKKDGTAVRQTYPIPGWTDMAKVSDSNRFIAGLRKDGTVVAVDFAEEAPANVAHLNVDGWTDMVDVAAGYVVPRDYVPNAGFPAEGVRYTVGLESDGTLRLAMDGNGFADAQNWRDIVSVVADEDILLGLQADGTVKYTIHPSTRNDWAERRERLAVIESWTDIIQIDSVDGLVVGLKADGTVVVNEPQADVSGWKDIVRVASVSEYIYGLKPDGTVVELNVHHPDWAKKTASWTNIRVPKWEPPVEESAEIQHVHTWAPATAGRPARCDGCGIMTGTALPQTISADTYTRGIKNNGTQIEENINNPCQVHTLYEDTASIYGDYFVRNNGTLGIFRSGKAVQNWMKPMYKWSDIVSVVSDPNGYIVAGLRRDGTVLTAVVSDDLANEIASDVKNWKDIVGLAAGSYTFWSAEKVPYLVGLKADGTLVFAAPKDLFPEARAWKDIVAVTAVEKNLLGLKADGTITADWNDDPNSRLFVPEDVRARVESWTDIIQLGFSLNLLVGLKTDGTVVAEKRDTMNFMLNDVTNWRDMVAISVGSSAIVGLKADGTTANFCRGVAFQNRWTDIKVPVWEPPAGEAAAALEPEAPTEAETVLSETVENKAILDISNVTFTYEPGEMANNPGSAGTMWVKYKVNGPKEVATVDFAFGFHEPPTQADIEDMVIQIIQARNAGIYKPTLCKTPFWDNIGYAAYPERGSTQYIAFMGFDKDNNFVGYTVIPEEIPQS